MRKNSFMIFLMLIQIVSTLLLVDMEKKEIDFKAQLENIKPCEKDIKPEKAMCGNQVGFDSEVKDLIFKPIKENR